jgi:DNA primase catalytic core
MTNRTVDQIHELNIYDVIKSYSRIELKKSGTRYKGLCPFHEEKTGSFTVSPEKGIYKCFGCDASGDAISFVMEHENLKFWEAITDIAKRFSLTMPKQMNKQEKEKAEQEQKHREALKIVNEFAKDLFIENLRSQKPEYIVNRISPETAKEFEIGFALNSWDNLRKTAREKQYKEHLLIDAGLLVNNNSKVYDRFRNRMMFPVFDFRGRIIGFSGRYIGNVDDTNAKYINSPESNIFKKGEHLFGLFQAKKSINEKKDVNLVEGNTDVTTLHDIGIKNTVAPLGTSFTKEQAKLLKRFTDSVTIIRDGDEAGVKATIRDGEILINHGFHTYVAMMPPDKDPDELFKGGTKEDFNGFLKGQRISFVEWYAHRLISVGPEDPNIKAGTIDKVCRILVNMEDYKANAYIDVLSKIIKPKKQWTDRLEELRNERKENGEEEKAKLPKGVDPESVEKYGFYEDNNCYYFRTKEETYHRVSNFILKPLFHIKQVNDSSRLFEMINVYKHREIIEIDIQSMVSIQSFRKVIESRGNYLFEGNDIHFMKLKRKLYDNTKTCELIEHLGWQKEGFFAFANGIYNGQWKDIDNNGIVSNGKKYFFIPALSDIYIEDKNIFMSERRFKQINREVTIEQWSDMFIKVFGDNAKIAICFFLATLFKDFISNQFKFFPILNAFGPPGTGKSQMAWSMMYLFGEAQNPYNLHNGTKVGLAEHLAEFSNAFAWIDEYKNAVDYDKIEMLKSAYDLIGRKKGGIEKGKKTKTSSVNAGIVITGQEMPTADVALLKRVILLQFYKSEFTEKEQKQYDALKDMEKAGLSHFTLEILKYREQFEREYFKVYDKVSSDIGKKLQDVEVEDRIFRNVTIIIAAFRFFEDKLNLNMSYDEMIELATQNIIDQSSFIINSAEKKNFWDTLEAAVENGQLSEGQDFKIDETRHIEIENQTKDLKTITKIIYLKFARIYEVYAETMRRTGQHPLPKSTLIFYLKTSKEFIGIKRSVRFGNHVTNAFIFNYKQLDLHLERLTDYETKEKDSEEEGKGKKIIQKAKQTSIPGEDKDDLPF